MRILILTHPRSGGYSLAIYIQKELNYDLYHEPFNYIEPTIYNEEFVEKTLTQDNIVVKDFVYHIERKGYNIQDFMSKFDKIIIHRRENMRDVVISYLYKKLTNMGSQMHVVYKIDDEWIKDNEDEIQKMMSEEFKMFYSINNIPNDGCLETTYDGIYNNKSDIPKLLEFLNIKRMYSKYLDILDNRHRLQNGDVGMENIKVRPNTKMI